MKLVYVKNEVEESSAFGKNKIIKLPLTIGKKYEVIFLPETNREYEKIIVYTDNQKWESFESSEDLEFLSLFKPVE
jgi:hypothetical protein